MQPRVCAVNVAMVTLRDRRPAPPTLEGQLREAEIKLEIASRPRVLHFVKGIVIVGTTYLRFSAGNRECILRDKPTAGWKLSSCCARPRNFN